jgi:RNA polymerase sigma-B factor
VTADPTDGAGPTTGEEEDVLSLFAELPDPAAQEAITERYRSLAAYLARKFAGRGEPIEDLQQVAMIGLLNAMNRFDPGREVKFSTYAAATIVGELKRHFRDKGWAVHVPRRLQELAVRLTTAVPELTGSLGRSPTVPELAAHLGVATDDVVEAMDAAQAYSTTSLEAPAGGTGLSPMDTLSSDDRAMADAEDWAAIAPSIMTLPERERRVLYLRFFEGRTQSEIAAEIGVSQMHVSRILTSTLAKLREDIGSPGEG